MNANNQSVDATSAGVADKVPVVNSKNVELQAIAVPEPKVVTHLQDMVNQHAAIREARIKKAQQQQTVDGTANAVKQPEVKPETVVTQNDTSATGQADDSLAAADTTSVDNESSDTQTPTSPRAEKRIGKLTARAKTAEEQLQTLQAELDKLKSEKAQAPKQPSPQTQVYEREVTEDEVKSWGDYAKEYDVGKLQTEHKKLTNFRDEINDALDIGAVKTDDAGREYLMEIGGQKLDKAQLVQIRRDLNKRVNEAIPSRFRAIQEVKSYKQQADSFIPQWVPEAMDKDSDVYQEMQVIKNSRFGWVLNEAPQAELYMTLGIKAAKEMLAKQQSETAKSVVKIPDKITTRSTPKPNIPMTAGPAMTSSEVTSEKRQEYERLKQIAQKSHRDEDAAAAISFKIRNKIK